MNADIASLIAEASSERRSLACVSRSWRSVFSSDDKVWAGSLYGDYRLREKVGPAKDEAGRFEVKSFPTFQAAWLAWRNMERELEDAGDGRIRFASIWKRAIDAWATIRRELAAMDVLRQTNLEPGRKDIVQTYRRGGTLACLEENPRLLESVRAIWGQHDGQNSRPGTGALFGTAVFYDQIRAIHLLPLAKVLAGSRSTDFNVPAGSFLLFGLGFRGSESVVYTNNRIIYAPESAPYIMQCEIPDEDPLVFFLERFAHDVSMYKRTEALIHRGVRVLSSFPQLGPRTSLAVTQNIRVKGAYTYIPGIQYTDGSLMWVYEFQIDLIDSTHPEYVKQEDRVWKNKAVLLTRHWTLVDPNKPPQVVQGDGVVGYNPCFDERSGRYREVLETMAWFPNPFAYRSCTYASPGSYMEGYLTFAPEHDDGSIEINRAFRVRVGRLSFQIPEFPF